MIKRVAKLSADRRLKESSLGERGFALLVVLWIIVAAALLVAAFDATMRSGATFVASEVQLAKTEALLDAGAEIAAAHLIDENETQRWLPDGRSHRIDFASVELTIAINDPNGLIDLNKTDVKLLLPFFRQFADSESKATQICDFIMAARAEASPGTKGQDGRGELNTTGRDPTARAAIAFLDINQLRGLQGMTPGLYRQVAPFVTVYGGSGRINPVTAPSAVLSSVPNLTSIDVERLRNAPKEVAAYDPLMEDIQQRAGSYLTNRSGPAYIVSVEVRRSTETHHSRKVFVILKGLDKEAPYRLIAKAPTTSAN